MSGLAEQASFSVIVLHELITEVFHGDGSKVPEPLGHFDPEFTMVTSAGKRIAGQEQQETGAGRIKSG
ncbi:hypothetical protein [Candidatus Erwinia dacicola]|uniref:Uncharacterized protein n=1 Tax=Candidatus Erwinia dacicola TaxID=252393 RepID=A0A1E7Z5B6_9GAMM|nr:hypothetical protein [Candidatus Erwinia dacicola]NJC99113.1 hypothetical protein [Candidatus Erwinia dacicola]OFC63828.1 hypothetical protein BBW68_03710 [Candidatus Erwinia dacicola]RAP70841.1 hypothetical protein ACZ87_02354 [Candidatus Erwinia dacicola]